MLGIKECARCYLTQAETARVQNMTPMGIKHIAKKQDIKFWDRKTPLNHEQMTIRLNTLTLLETAQ